MKGLIIIDNGQPMDHADSVNALRELGEAEDFERGDLHTSLSRMYEYELRMKNGIVKTEQFSRR